MSGGAADLKYTQFGDDPDESHMLGLGLLEGARRVLEVGAATGYVSQEIQRRGAVVVAVEVDESAAAIARTRGVDVRVGDLAAVLRPDERFDAVLLMDVIEHIVDADRVLDAVLAHLEPGGSIVLSVPNVAHWSVRLALARGRFDYTRTGLMDDTHVHFYTAATLEALLRRHGLRVVDRKHSMGLGAYHRPKSHTLQWQQRKWLRKLVPFWPTLFGYQFIWRAVRDAGT